MTLGLFRVRRPWRPVSPRRVRGSQASSWHPGVVTSCPLFPVPSWRPESTRRVRRPSVVLASRRRRIIVFAVPGVVASLFRRLGVFAVGRFVLSRSSFLPCRHLRDHRPSCLVVLFLFVLRLVVVWVRRLGRGERRGEILLCHLWGIAKAVIVT